VGRTKRGKSTKLTAMADGVCLPLAVHVTNHSPHEVTLAKPTHQARFIQQIQQRLLADWAFDSDPLCARLARRHIELVAPLSPQSQEGGNPRWLAAAALQAALEDGAPFRLAAEFPSAGCPLRAASGQFPSFRPCRLHRPARRAYSLDDYVRQMAGG
jgi:hypothetical protein